MHLKKGCCPSNIQPHPSRNYVQPAAPKCATRNAQCAASDAQTPIKQPVHEIGLITLHVVSGKATSLLWNEYMARYHYLGYAAMSGSQIRYNVFAGDQLVACISFCACAWKLKDREKFIGWSEAQRL